MVVDLALALGAKFYYSGCPHSTLNDFNRGEFPVLVSTSAAADGFYFRYVDIVIIIGRIASFYNFV